MHSHVGSSAAKAQVNSDELPRVTSLELSLQLLASHQLKPFEVVFVVVVAKTNTVLLVHSGGEQFAHS